MVKKQTPVKEETFEEKIEKLTVGELIDALEERRQKRKPLDAESARIKAEYDQIAQAIIEKLDATNVLKQGTSKAAVSISETVVPVMKDPDAFVKWAVRTKNVHLFTSNCISSPSWRESVAILSKLNSEKDLLDALKDEKRKLTLPPGTELFKKRSLNHSSLKG